MHLIVIIEIIDDNNDIAGTISYEKYDNMVLIRYFVFKRNIEKILN